MAENGAATPVKLCHQCGKDVSRIPRIRDAAQQYWCVPCANAAKAAANRSAAGVSPGASGTMAAIMPADARENPKPAAGRAGLHFLQPRHLGLLSQVTCPHCWHKFAPQEILWITQHEELRGDPMLGAQEQGRFLPTRFTVDGRAIDARGAICQHLACPHCHLGVPRTLLEAEPLFLSLVGGPTTGKSSLLTSMAWELRRILPVDFSVAFTDLDSGSNRLLNEAEERLFLADDPTVPVAIPKTQLEGEGYDRINMGSQQMQLPRPLLFALRRAASHPLAEQGDHGARVLCLYDNAGEYFLPGMDRATSPVTEHLAQSRAFLFIFDPTQDPRFRQRLREVSNDPQLKGKRGPRQEMLLNEAAQRIRRFANLPPQQKVARPLVVLVSKSDTWSSLVKLDLESEPIIPRRGAVPARVDAPRIAATSAAVRALLQEHVPELVAMAENTSQHVLYLPVSALGHSPEADQNGENRNICPRDVRPHWVTAALLYMFSQWTTAGLIFAADSRAPAGADSGPAVGAPLEARAKN